jgi:hypothetical protein
MRAVFLMIVIVAVAGQYRPLVYESFETKGGGYGGANQMLSRTCVYFSGHTLVSKRFDGEYLYKCPRRQETLSIEAPSLVD